MNFPVIGLSPHTSYRGAAGKPTTTDQTKEFRTMEIRLKIAQSEIQEMKLGGFGLFLYGSNHRFPWSAPERLI